MRTKASFWRRLSAGLASILFLQSVPPGAALEYDYLPISQSVVTKRFAQRLICESLSNQPQSLKIRDTQALLSERGQLSVFGSDNNGKPWSLIAENIPRAVAIWTADLDRNGQEDLIIFCPMESVSFLPSARIFLLLFEKSGRPSVWCGQGFFEADYRGLKELIDSDSDGRAELVHQWREERYWLTDLLRVRNCHLSRAQGFGGNVFPLKTKFTVTPNHKVVVQTAVVDNSEKAGPSSASSSLRHDSPIKNLDWKFSSTRLILEDGRQLFLADEAGDTVVVINETAGLRMVTGFGESTKRLLREIYYRQMSLECFFGEKSSGRHRPQTICARPESEYPAHAKMGN